VVVVVGKSRGDARSSGTRRRKRNLTMMVDNIFNVWRMRDH
jgi:hypothetical protein